MAAPPPRAAPTIRDLARAAGVSIGTASKALNGGGRLRQETRDRVLAAASAIGYRPNDLAHSLRRARSRTIGIISNDSFGRFTIPIVEALEERLADAGIAVFMCNATDDPARERQHLDQLLRKRVDGLVVTARRADRRAPIGPFAHGLPVVYVFSQADDPAALCLLPDDRGGAELATRHLAALGRRRIAHVTGPEHFEAVRLRAEGWRAALAAAGLPELPGAYLAGPWSEAWGREAVARLLDGGTAPDALFCGNDQIARGAADALRERDLAVPGAVAIVGFDNWEVMTLAARPPLTSIDMNLRALGREAGDRLLQMIAGAPVSGVCRRPCTLVVRELDPKGRRMMKLAPVPFVDVAIEGDFWRERLETVLTRTIPSQHVQLGAHGILEALTLPDPPPPLRFPRNEHDFTVQVFWDSDVGKWIEAASYALSHRRDDAIESKIEAITDDLARAQAPDGYLNSWYFGREPDKRWTNLRDNHELYNLGHLLEGGIAYFLATGRRRLLDILERYVAHVRETFGPDPGQKRGYDGHQEIELALIKLYRLTGDRRHLALAAYFIDERGQEPHYFDAEARARGEDPKDFWAKSYEYNQSHRPVREQDRVVGHAVRAMYMYSAMADLAAELGDESLKRACETLWQDVMASKVYITSGLGPAAANEGFTEAYDLPNATAYAETCASVALIFWAQRMLHLDLDGRYADMLEQALFNNALCGLSRDGEHYFYSNPLDSDGRHERWAWHTCPCCTMNASRLIASVGGYFVSAGEDTIALHLYGGIATTLPLAAGKVALREESTYPWSGAIRVTVTPERPTAFTLKLRIPGWTRGATAAVNGAPVDVPAATRSGYLTISRTWAPGDEVALDLPMPPERFYAHPAVTADLGRVALRRGPLVYCLEEADNPGAPVQRLTLPRSAALRPEPRDDLWPGVIALAADAERLADSDWNATLYRPDPPQRAPAPLTAIPYFLWNNRTRGSMTVWIPEA